MTWVVIHKYSDHYVMVDESTGQMKKVALATDAQWGYLENLRAELTNRPPLKERPPAYKAAKQIDKLLEKKEKLERQTELSI